MEELPGLLEGLKGRGDGFRSPDKFYFEEMAKASLREAVKPAVKRRLPARWLSIAAAVMLLLTTGWFLRETSGNGQGEIAGQELSSDELLNQLSAEDIDAYIDEQLYDFETELYAEAPINR